MRAFTNLWHWTIVPLLLISHATTVVAADSACSYSLSPPDRNHGYGATNGMVSITTSNDCAWTAVNTNDWITIVSSLSGVGSTDMLYEVTENSSLEPRTGVVTIEGAPFTLSQNGFVCTYKLSPTTRQHGYGAATNSITLTTGPECSWTIVNSNNWITINTNLSGTGSLEISYTITENTSLEPRSGVVQIGDAQFVLDQSNQTCSYSLSSNSRDHGYGATDGTNTLTTLSECPWTILNNNDWITITSATSGMGSVEVTYSVAANPHPGERIGVVMVADQEFTLTQRAAPCIYDLSPTTRQHGHGAASDFVTLITGSHCPWTIVNNNDWVTIISDTSGMGSAEVAYLVDANPNPSGRTGIVMVADQELTLTQSAAPCIYDLSPATRQHGYGAATNSITLTTGPECSWTIVNNNNWITINTNLSGTGSLEISYTITENTSLEPRSGVVQIGDAQFVLDQSNQTCSYSLSSNSRDHGYGATDGTNTLTTLSECPWTILNNNDWITITSATSGMGSVEVTYSVAANPHPGERIGVVMVADQEFTLTQRAAPCIYDLSPTTRQHGHGAASGSITLTAGSACPWTIENNNDWITIVTSLSGTGNSEISYTITENTSLESRSGVVLIGDAQFVVDQFGQTCDYRLSPTDRTHGYGAAVDAISLLTDSQCSWTIINTNGWISITSTTSGTGSVEVAYSVAANPSSSQRTGIVVVADQELILIQRAAPCTYSIDPPDQLHESSSESGIVQVTAIDGCPWTVVNTNDWITITSPANGTGDGTVNYTVSANPGYGLRGGIIQIAEHDFNVSQRGLPCDYTVTPRTHPHSGGASTGLVTVTTSDDCTWSINNTNDWISFPSGDSGIGSQQIEFEVSANPILSTRSGFVVIANVEIVVLQAAGVCNFELSPSERTHGYGATAGVVDVSTLNACHWEVHNTNNWISITSNADNTGPDEVQYDVEANPDFMSRTGTIQIGDEFFVLNQRGRPCTYKVSPSTRTHGNGATIDTFTFTTSGQCSWNIVNTNTWIDITTSLTGSGSMEIGYTVEANTTPMERVGTLVIADQTLTLTQRGITCTTTLSPTNRTHGNGATDAWISVSTGPSCPWTVINTNDWIGIQQPTNGTGEGNINYTIEENISPFERTGAVLIGEESFTLTQRGAFCTFYIVPPTNQVVGFEGATGQFEMLNPQGCSWAVVNTNNWITILTGASGIGDATIAYAVAANPGLETRTGFMKIPGDPLGGVFSVTQDGSTCPYTLSPSETTIGSEAATGQVSVTTGDDCNWTASTASDWITITSTNGGTGSGQIDYTVQSNLTADSRTGVINIGYQAFTLTQMPGRTTFSGITRMAGGAIRLTLTGAPGEIWQILVSEDLRHWEPLTTMTLTSGTAEYTDNETNSSPRFYRAAKQVE